MRICSPTSEFSGYRFKDSADKFDGESADLLQSHEPLRRYLGQCVTVHFPLEEIPSVLQRLINALKPDGILFASFKHETCSTSTFTTPAARSRSSTKNPSQQSSPTCPQPESFERGSRPTQSPRIAFHGSVCYYKCNSIVSPNFAIITTRLSHLLSQTPDPTVEPYRK